MPYLLVLTLFLFTSLFHSIVDAAQALPAQPPKLLDVFRMKTPVAGAVDKEGACTVEHVLMLGQAWEGMNSLAMAVNNVLFSETHASRYSENEEARKTMLAFFRIRNVADSTDILPEDMTRWRVVQNNLKAWLLAAQGIWQYQHKPWLFCGDGFLQWTTSYLDMKGQPISAMVPFRQWLDALDKPGAYWSKDMGAFVLSNYGEGSRMNLQLDQTHGLCSPSNLNPKGKAAVVARTTRSTDPPFITLCNLSWNRYPRWRMLMPNSNIPPLDQFFTLSYMFAHELFHMISPRIIDHMPFVPSAGEFTSDLSKWNWLHGRGTYGTMNSLFLSYGAPDKAVLNADSYTLCIYGWALYLFAGGNWNWLDYFPGVSAELLTGIGVWRSGSLEPAMIEMPPAGADEPSMDEPPAGETAGTAEVVELQGGRVQWQDFVGA